VASCCLVAGCKNLIPSGILIIMDFEKIGFIGLGKLGLPCAAAMSHLSKKMVYGFDINEEVARYVKECAVPYQEEFADEYLEKSEIKICNSIAAVVKSSDIVFVAVQTPHEPEYEGVTPVPTTTKDFNYSYLESVFDEIADFLRGDHNKAVHLVVISTVLPGTMRARILPKIAEFRGRVKFSYNPYFIAMGQTISDFMNPEFILIGTDSVQDGTDLAKFYSNFLNAPSRIMQIESAELTKVAYNTFIGFKIVFANTIAEIVDSRGGNSDEVTDALSVATSRLMSPKYLRAGMADGGGCHPRDQIAMSHLAKTANLSVNPFDWLAKARDSQTLKQAELIKSYFDLNNLPVTILGSAYKKNVNLTIGSPAKLLSVFLTRLGINHKVFDPWVNSSQQLDFNAGIYFIATNHDSFKNLRFAPGSICIDPWGDMLDDQPEITIVRPGREVKTQ